MCFHRFGCRQDGGVTAETLSAFPTGLFRRLASAEEGASGESMRPCSVVPGVMK
jgi:hypothetical protein